MTYDTIRKKIVHMYVFDMLHKYSVKLTIGNLTQSETKFELLIELIHLLQQVSGKWLSKKAIKLCATL